MCWAQRGSYPTYGQASDNGGRRVPGLHPLGRHHRVGSDPRSRRPPTASVALPPVSCGRFVQTIDPARTSCEPVYVMRRSRRAGTIELLADRLASALPAATLYLARGLARIRRPARHHQGFQPSPRRVRHHRGLRRRVAPSADPTYARHRLHPGRHGGESRTCLGCPGGTQGPHPHRRCARRAGLLLQRRLSRPGANLEPDLRLRGV